MSDTRSEFPLRHLAGLNGWKKFDVTRNRSVFTTRGQPEREVSTNRDSDATQISQGDASKKRSGESTDGVTLEPMLYNVYTLGVFQKLLDDPFTRKASFKHLVHFVL